MLGRLKFEVDALAEEMLDNIPEEMFVSDTTTFLDPAMGGGQFLKSVILKLRKYGHSDDNIAGRVFGYETNKMRVKFAAKQCGNVGKFVVKDFLDEDMDKKFDVIIGNPPFQHNGSSKGNKLWPKFVITASRMLAKDGYMAMVIPAGWSSGGNNIPGNKGIIKDVFQKFNLKYASFKNLQKFFPNIGVSFSYFIMNNSPSENCCVIETDNGKVTLDINSVDFLPDNINDITLSIYEKLFSKKSFDIKSFDRQKDENKSEVETAVNNVKHWVLGSGDKIQYCYLPYDKTPDMRGIKKVLIPIRKFSDKPMIHIDFDGISVCQQGFYLPLSDNLQEQNVKSVWESTLYKFMVYGIHPTGFLKTNIIKSIPCVEMDKKWTDEELYAHFGLTQEEIEYIEANVK